MKPKIYADNKRGARPSDIAVGDRALLKQSRENKLSTNFEPHPYKVVRRDGNAVVVEDANGNNRMRGIAHMKKYIVQEGNQQNPNPFESPASEVKVPTADVSSQDISSQSKNLLFQNLLLQMVMSLLKMFQFRIIPFNLLFRVLYQFVIDVHQCDEGLYTFLHK